MTASSKSTRKPPARAPVVVDDIDGVVAALRVARVKKAPLAVTDLVVRAPSVETGGAIVIDADNGLADVDARLSLAVIGAALARRGYTLPLMRPWSARPLWRLAISAPFVVDALVQRGTLLTVDGDAVDAPRAPRHAAGPSVVHAVCGPVPLAFLARATLRVVPQTHAHLVVTDHGSVAAAVDAFVAVTAAARAIAADAFGARVAVLAADHAISASDDGHTPPAERGRSWGTMAARIDSSRSIAPGDVVAIRAALLAGDRVAAVPFMQRAAVLRRRPLTSTLVDLPTAAGALATALIPPARSTSQERP